MQRKDKPLSPWAKIKGRVSITNSSTWITSVSGAPTKLGEREKSIK
tara:strand:+ start:405 stop:542 length:138 start_codon:yes stop_codon:yes gene_type:complete